MSKKEEYILPFCTLILGCIIIICYSLFAMDPILTGGIFSTLLSIIEILSGRAVVTKEFKGLTSTLKITKRNDRPSEFNLHTLAHAFLGIFLVLMVVLKNKI